MGGRQNVDLDDPLPPWASGLAHGDYTVAGAVLPTRDGRVCGNATVISGPKGNGPICWLVLTDAGNEMHLTEAEIKERFWPPTWTKLLPDLESVEAVELAMSLPDALPDQVDRNAVIVAVAILASSIIGTLVPQDRRAAVAEVFCNAVRDSVEAGELH